MLSHVGISKRAVKLHVCLTAACCVSAGVSCHGLYCDVLISGLWVYVSVPGSLLRARTAAVTTTWPSASAATSSESEWMCLSIALGLLFDRVSDTWTA